MTVPDAWELCRGIQSEIKAAGFVAPLTYHQESRGWRITVWTREHGPITFRPTPGLVGHVLAHYTPIHHTDDDERTGTK